MFISITFATHGDRQYVSLHGQVLTPHKLKVHSSPFSADGVLLTWAHNTPVGKHSESGRSEVTHSMPWSGSPFSRPVSEELQVHRPLQEVTKTILLALTIGIAAEEVAHLPQDFLAGQHLAKRLLPDAPCRSGGVSHPWFSRHGHKATTRKLRHQGYS